MLPPNSEGGMEVLEIVSALLRLLAVCVCVCVCVCVSTCTVGGKI